MERFDMSGAWDRARLLAEAAKRRARARGVAGVASQVPDTDLRAALADFVDLLDRDAAAFEAKAAILQAITASTNRANGMIGAERA